MKLNLKINNNMSLQGIYKIKSGDTTDTVESSDSLGFDFIWKKTFK